MTMAGQMKARYTADNLPLKILTYYIKSLKKFPDRKNKEMYTKELLSMFIRPPSLWPVIRLLFPSVRGSFFYSIPSLDSRAVV